MTFVATASCAAILGATVVFADVDEDTALIDPSAVEAVVTERTKVIAAVDYAGHPRTTPPCSRSRTRSAPAPSPTRPTRSAAPPTAARSATWPT